MGYPPPPVEILIMHRPIYSILLFSLVLLSRASAQESPWVGSNLRDYLQQAQRENPQLKTFEARYEAAMKRIPQASALPDPMFQVTHFVEAIQTRTGPQENVFMLSQTIPWFGKLSSREDAASAEAEALWFAYQNQQLALARAVSIAYYEYAYTGKAIELTRKNLDLLGRLEPIVEEKVKAGNDLNDLLRLKVELGKAEDALSTLRQKRIAQSARLQELLAIGGTGVLPWPQWAAPASYEPDGPSLGLALEENNPELAMLERKINSAEARREIARMESYPDITLGLNYVQLGDPINPNTPDAGQDPWGFTVAVTLPIWFEKYSAARAEALANMRASQNEYDSRRNMLKADLSASLALLHDADRRLRLYGEDLLGLAEQAAENTRTSYESGRSDIPDVIETERDVLELQTLYWRAAADAWQQIVTLQTLVNQPILGTFQAAQTR